MPELSGLDLCRALRSDPTTASALIVIVTARALPADREAALAGTITCQQAVLARDALLELVRHVL